MSLDRVLSHIDAQRPHYTSQLAEFVRIPSISAGAENRQQASIDIGRAADFLVADLQSLGLQARAIQVIPDTNPLVVAHPELFSPTRPTVLIYGHYDVQGVDNPRSAWNGDPFAADEQEGYLIGRGASDNKGQLMTHIKAVDAILKTGAPLPVNPVFLIEGEEECGSQSIARFIAEGGLDAFAPFLCTLVSDNSMYGPDQPSLTIGLRGLAFTELTVRGAKHDVHSGVFGGIAPNPNNLLVRTLASLFDPAGRIAIPGFYEAVEPLTARERALYAQLPVDPAEYCRTLGIDALVGEPGYSLLEQRWARPTLDIHYLSSGSPRTVIPAQARAALSCRLVPNQDPAHLLSMLQDFIRRQLPDGGSVEFGATHTAAPYRLQLDHPLVAPVMRAIRTGFQVEPVLSGEGGSIPIVPALAAASSAPVLLIGFGQFTDNWHGPNEHFSLRDFHRGIRTAAALLYELGQLPPTT